MRFGPYKVHFSADAFATAKTIIQVKAGAATPIELERVSITQGSITTSNQLRAVIRRKTAAATVTSFTPIKGHGSDRTADAAGGTSATGTNASAEGTDGDILEEEGFNSLGGYLWMPTPEGRLWVPAGGIVGVILVGTVPSANWRATVTFFELPG